MKQYVIDELRPGEADQLKDCLQDDFGPPEMGNLFWIPVPEELLSETQQAHETCRPFYFVIEIDDNRVACELLVRTRAVIRCDCIRYATAGQREWLISTMDTVFDKLGIIT